MAPRIPKPLTNPFLAIAVLAVAAFLPVFVACAILLLTMIWYERWDPGGHPHAGIAIGGMTKVAVFWLGIAAMAVFALYLEWRYLVAIWEAGKSWMPLFLS